MIGISVADVLGLGYSPKTAYLYSRLIDRVAGLLETRGTDLEACSGADIAMIADQFRVSHSARSQLRAALAVAWDLLGRRDPPLRAVRVPPKPRGRCRALSHEAATRLERAAWDRGDDLGLVVLLGLYAGLRRAEIAHLRWEDVKLDEHGHPSWVRVVNGKGGLTADVPVHPVLAAALAARRRPAGWVFEGRSSGRPVTPATIWSMVREVALQAGLADVPTHVLRHTALAECNDRSGDLRAVQEIARHSRPETTAGYTRVDAARLRRVVAQIDYGRVATGDEAA